MLPVILFFSLALIIPNSIAHPKAQLQKSSSIKESTSSEERKRLLKSEPEVKPLLLADSKLEFVHPKLYAPISYESHQQKSAQYPIEAARRLDTRETAIFRVDSPSNGFLAPSGPVEHKPSSDLRPAESAWGGGWIAGGGWGHHQHHHHGGHGHHGGGWGHHHHHHGWHRG